MLSEISRYWHTLRHLRPVQFYARAWCWVTRPRVDVGVAPTLRPTTGVWQAPACREPSLIGTGQFIFLGRSGSLSDVGWNGPAREKLWRYNQHYFDDLNAGESAARRPWHLSLLTDWVARNPPGLGDGWDPYPTSLRIVNWVKWSLAGNALPGPCVHSLAVQTRWLSKRLERHLLGNHLFANAKALVFAGLFFGGPEACGWLETGLRIIDRELPEQVLPDGGNFERSPMYHSLFLEDLLDLLNAVAAWPGTVTEEQSAAWRLAAGRMVAWLKGLVHPDGEIGLFNDAAMGIAPTPSALRAYGERLGIRMPETGVPSQPHQQHWPDSGYVRMSSEHAVALLDVAPVGPDYLPGHAHADTLSFELSVWGRRLVVNGGTSCYGKGPGRTRERSTASHSTVEVAGQNSSEVWDGFRVARRARPFDLQSGGGSSGVWTACSHDGYRRLPGRPVHRRTWLLDDDGLTVADTVTLTGSRAGYPSVARFILHPEVQIAAAGAGVWHLAFPGVARGLQIFVRVGFAQLEQAKYAPRFGRTIATHCLAVQLTEGRAETRISWA